VLRPLYHRLLRQVDPELLVLVVSYGRGMKILIEVAKDLDIPVVELQHGVIHTEHAGYDYPSDVEIGLFSDWLLTFGEFWTTQAQIPIDSERIMPVGFPWLEAHIERVGPVSPRDHLLFISQGTVGERLSQLAVACAADRRISSNVIYKLHPGEADRWREAYPWLIDSDVTVVDGKTPTLYELFAEARAQVGVGSTAIYEGLCFDLETYEYDIEGASTLMPLVDAGAAKMIDSAGALSEKMGCGINKLNRGHLFANDAVSKSIEKLNWIRIYGERG